MEQNESLMPSFMARDTTRPAKALRIECTTWSRDSHGLFDYEARHVNVRTFMVSKSARLFRINAEVECVAETAPIPYAAKTNTDNTNENTTENGETAQTNRPAETSNTDFLMSLRYSREGKFFVVPADRSLYNTSSVASILPQKLWSIVREQNGNKHILQENDVIKLGRYKLRVKQLVTQSKREDDASGIMPEVPELRLEDGEPPVSIIAPDDTQCRICLLEGNQEGDPLIAPCDCKGSIKFVHLECLRHWISGRLNFTELQHRPYFVKLLHCELCKLPYPSAIRYNNERMPVITVPRAEPPFIVLENMAGNHQKGVYVISMVSKKDLKLGRGHESDVRIPDVSISRYHATIRFVDGSFQLEDHNSKFGTLVSLRRPFPVGDSVAALQVGRSVVKLSFDNSANAVQDSIIEISNTVPQQDHTIDDGFVTPPGNNSGNDTNHDMNSAQPNQGSATDEIQDFGDFIAQHDAYALNMNNSFANHIQAMNNNFVFGDNALGAIAHVMHRSGLFNMENNNPAFNHHIGRHNIDYISNTMDNTNTMALDGYSTVCHNDLVYHNPLLPHIIHGSNQCSREYNISESISSNRHFGIVDSLNALMPQGSMEQHLMMISNHQNLMYNAAQQNKMYDCDNTIIHNALYNSRNIHNHRDLTMESIDESDVTSNRAELAAML